MEVKGKFWIEHEGSPVLGRGRAELLTAIVSEGSIQGAARKMGLSYRHAWSMLKASEQRTQGKLVETWHGGKGGGGAELTDYGRALLEKYRCVESRFERFLEEVQHEVDRGDI
jgi:molybdate transport system regulatory protein